MVGLTISPITQPIVLLLFCISGWAIILFLLILEEWDNISLWVTTIKATAEVADNEDDPDGPFDDAQEEHGGNDEEQQEQEQEQQGIPQQAGVRGNGNGNDEEQQGVPQAAPGAVAGIGRGLVEEAMTAMLPDGADDDL